MKLLEYSFEKDFEYVHNLFGKYNIAFIDIETDGLSHKNKIVLIGMVIFSEKARTGITIQLFNEDYHSERLILNELFTLLKEHQIDYFISFNGDSFDFPFINARLKALKMNHVLNKKFNIDLLRVIRKNKSLFPFESYSLKSVEKFIGIDRVDTISGKESVILYHSFIETKDPKLEQIILLHNYDDIINMVPLLKIYTMIDFDLLSVKCKLAQKQFYLLSCEFKNNNCILYLGHPYEHSSLDQYYHSLGASFEQNEAGITLTFETKKLAMKDSQTRLTIVDTNSVLNIDFLSLTQSDKEKYLIAVDHKIHWDNLAHLVEKIYAQYIE